MGGLTDLDARGRSCRAVGLSQRRGLGSHVQRNGTGMYGVEGGRGEKEGDEVRVLAKTMAGTSSVNSVFFVAISLVCFLFPPNQTCWVTPAQVDGRRLSAYPQAEAFCLCT